MFWYSNKKDVAELYIVSGWSCIPSKRNLFRAVQIDQVITVQSSKSRRWFDEATAMVRSRKSKFSVWDIFWSLPGTIPQTFRAMGQAHRMWVIVSVSILQNRHLGSTMMPLCLRLFRVGREAVHARHSKCLHFDGTLSLHIDFQNLLRWIALELSEWEWSRLAWRVWWYADRTVKSFDLVFCQQRRSGLVMAFSWIAKIADASWGAKFS